MLKYGKLIIDQLQTDAMTPEERLLSSLTRKNLKTLPNWHKWDAAYDKQLDQHFEAGVFGKPVLRSSLPPEEQSRVLRLHWTNVVKPDGQRKSRCCINGSKRAAPWLQLGTQTYSSCIETPCMRLFVALAAREGMIINFGIQPMPSNNHHRQLNNAMSKLMKLTNHGIKKGMETAQIQEPTSFPF